MRGTSELVDVRVDEEWWWRLIHAEATLTTAPPIIRHEQKYKCSIFLRYSFIRSVAKTTKVRVCPPPPYDSTWSNIMLRIPLAFQFLRICGIFLLSTCALKVSGNELEVDFQGAQRFFSQSALTEGHISNEVTGAGDITATIDSGVLRRFTLLSETEMSEVLQLAEVSVLSSIMPNCYLWYPTDTEIMNTPVIIQTETRLGCMASHPAACRHIFPSATLSLRLLFISPFTSGFFQPPRSICLPRYRDTSSFSTNYGPAYFVPDRTRIRPMEPQFARQLDILLHISYAGRHLRFHARPRSSIP